MITLRRTQWQAREEIGAPVSTALGIFLGGFVRGEGFSATAARAGLVEDFERLVVTTKCITWRFTK